MESQRFKFWNNLAGWIIFAIAFSVYLATLEPTTSLWDTGEFIAAAHKLQVVHPPGAPFFLLLNRLTSMFAPGPNWVAPFVNGTSALASAFTIIFLFWTITGLARRIIQKDNTSLEKGPLIAILGSGAIGSLAFTFSDTFWFSAVEGEVYALSSFFMSIIFWLMLKWENKAPQPGHSKYLILIAYLTGLSIGVHLLSLLVIPALAYIYYFKRFKPTWRGGVITGIVGIGVLATINFGLIRWFPSLAAQIELLFVNSLNFPFWSGIFFTIILFTGILIGGVYWSYNNQRPVLNTILLAMVAILIGYSTYSMVVIRSNADPSIDMNNPETVFNLKSYLNREQYGSRDLLYGPYFNTKVERYKKGAMEYKKGKEKYIPLGHKEIPIYDAENQTIFPRMGDRSRQDRINFYREWENLDKGETPTFGENLHFFLTYQIGHMWWRYFAWNFIGRQNDLKGSGQEFHQGNWLTGFDLIDQHLLNLGPQDNLPPYLKNNPARNFLYGLPFLIGLLGMVFHFRKDPEKAFATLVFFFMTGIALIIYLNNPPLEPRERDYTSVGSFYAFAIWIGLGALGIIDQFNKNRKWSMAVVISTLVALCFVPALMAKEEWNDHDRSNRYFAKNLAYNYLNSCDSNAVLFTSGDNETYPLWYAQEVEGIRTDVRVVNLSLLNMGWYQEQLRKPAHGAKAIPFSISSSKVEQNKLSVLYYKQLPQLNKNQHYDLSRIIQFIASDKPRTKVTTQEGEQLDFLPARKFRIPVPKNRVLKNGTVHLSNQNQIVDYLRFKYPQKYMQKADLLVLDFIATNKWRRPVYFSITSGSDAYVGLQEYFRMDGMVYRLVPVPEGRDIDNQTGWVNPAIAYKNIMNKFQWGNLPSQDLYINNVMRRQCTNYRNIFNRLANALVAQNQNEKAVKVLDRSLKVMPRENVPYDFGIFQTVNHYYNGNVPEKGKNLAQLLSDIFAQELDYYLSLDKKLQSQVNREIRTNLYCIRQMSQLAQDNGQGKFAKQLMQEYRKYDQMYQ